MTTTAMQRSALNKLAGQWKSPVVDGNVETKPVALTPPEADALKAWFTAEKLTERLSISEALRNWLEQDGSKEKTLKNTPLNPGEFTVGKTPLMAIGADATAETIGAELTELGDARHFSISLHPSDFNRLKDTYPREEWFSQANKYQGRFH
jgi:hypothetical protein